MRKEKRRSFRDGNFCRQRETGRVREKRGKKGREEKRELLSRDGNYFRCERGRRGRKVLLATEILRRERETGGVRREREEKEGESAKRDERREKKRVRREKTGIAGKSAKERGSERKEGERFLSRHKNFCRERGLLWRERKERGKREE